MPAGWVSKVTYCLTWYHGACPLTILSQLATCLDNVTLRQHLTNISCPMGPCLIQIISIFQRCYHIAFLVVQCVIGEDPTQKPLYDTERDHTPTYILIGIIFGVVPVLIILGCAIRACCCKMEVCYM